MFPRGSYLFVTQHWWVFWPGRRRKWLSFSHKSESNILSKVTVLHWWPIHLLSHGPLSHCLTHSTFRQYATVFVSCAPTSIVSMQRRWGCSQASRSLGGRLKSAAAACSRANHVDYCDYRPFPPTSVTLRLTDLDLPKVPVAIGDPSSCSAPSKSSPHTPQLLSPLPPFLHSNTIGPWSNLGTVSSRCQASHEQEVY